MAYTVQPKKLMIINILDILRKYSDESHRLSQSDIVEMLLNEYGMKAGRKAIKRNLDALMEFGYNIEFTEIKRSVLNSESGEKEEGTMTTGYYLVRDFSDPELRLLIDSVMASRYIPSSKRKQMVEKLEKLSSKYFTSRIKHILFIGEEVLQNSQLFYTIEMLDEAITNGKRVSFHYNEYGIDHQLHQKTDEEGETKLYEVSPYQMVASNGRYYLICRTCGHDDISHYRVDKISEIQVLEEDARPVQEIEGLENGLNLSKHLTEHINMFAGKTGFVEFRFHKSIFNDVIDTFGSDILFYDEREESVGASLIVGRTAIKIWAEQHPTTVQIVSPADLAEEICKDFLKALKLYKEVQ